MAAQDYYNSFSNGASRPSQPQPIQHSPHQQPLYPASAYPPQTPPNTTHGAAPPVRPPSEAPPPYSLYQNSPPPHQQTPPNQLPVQRPPQQQGGPYYPHQPVKQDTYPPARPPIQGVPGAQYLRPPSGNAYGPNGAPLKSALKPPRPYSSPPDERRNSYSHPSPHHHHHRRDSDEYSDDDSRPHSRSRSRSRSGSYSNTRSGHGSHRRKDKAQHQDMDTFLGAGGGAIIGDAIFPGLGTIGGLLIGGYGGREFAKKNDPRTRRDRDVRHHEGSTRRSRSSVPDYRYSSRD